MDKISINKVDKKTSKNKSDYLLVETSQGKMSVFDDSLFKQVNSAIGKEIEAIVITSADGKYKNIVELGQVLGDAKQETSNQYGRDPKTIVWTDCYKMAVELHVADPNTDIHGIAEELYKAIMEKSTA